MHIFLTQKIFSFLTKRAVLDEVAQIKLKYVIQILVNDSLKIMMILGFAVVIGRLEPFFYAMLALMFLRPFSGGFHLRGFFSCLLFTEGLLCMAVLLNDLVFLNPISRSFTGCVVIIIFMLWAPIIPKERPRYSLQRLRVFKRNALLILSVHLIGLVLLPSMPYFNQAFWVIILLCLQLVLAKGFESYYGRKVETH